ncbi:Uroplakin-1b [Acipenser ruthenus]|uniref:Uroplakin-1b n=1 Tax=Acipenser ruthenus TaxID=7906 RepID=A0A444UR64_ACIRT|nr:Uroplakin-1b [Acipenser ruthenus]
MVYEGGNDSIFRGTWIGLFTGLAYFCTSILGMYCIMKSKRILLLVMLRRYNKPLPEAMPSTLDEIYMTSGITHSWNRFMTEVRAIINSNALDTVGFNISHLTFDK